jgi:type III pantothenate kinase
MLHLVIDIGNTNAKLAWFKEDVFLEKEIVQLSEIEDFVLKMGAVSRVVISDVTGKAKNFINFLERRKIQVLEVNTSLKLPIDLKNYTTTETLGHDRLANLCGAQKLVPNKNVLIIDAGTCLKTDLLNAQREFVGGNISPGYHMRLKSLHLQTGKLPLFTGENCSEKPFGTSTQLAIENGVYYGMLYEIEGAIKQAEKLFPDCTVILTGGNASLFGKALKNSIFAHPELTLIGLHSILKNNA